ncbi:hypothetical protein, partial [Demequina silvatica]|uniref:hypothetical protein n=1 Tax=Demequina silvatica TaxID=1638988 RepID=UPI000B2D8259
TMRRHGVWVAIATGVALLSPIAVAHGAPVASDGSVIASIRADLPWQTWGACGISTAKNKTIATFKRYGTVQTRLWCGTDTWGFRHIEMRHAVDFENVAAGTNLAGNWRYMADYAIRNVLANPAVKYYRGNNKYCYSRSLPVRDARTGQYLKWRIFQVVVDIRQNKIISATPARGHCVPLG